jgi:hypothetical protein
MSIMVGIGRSAQTGVLIKNSEALEHMEKVIEHALRRETTEALISIHVQPGSKSKHPGIIVL